MIKEIKPILDQADALGLTENEIKILPTNTLESSLLFCVLRAENEYQSQNLGRFEEIQGQRAKILNSMDAAHLSDQDIAKLSNQLADFDAQLYTPTPNPENLTKSNFETLRSIITRSFLITNGTPTLESEAELEADTPSPAMTTDEVTLVLQAGLAAQLLRPILAATAYYEQASLMASSQRTEIESTLESIKIQDEELTNKLKDPAWLANLNQAEKAAKYAHVIAEKRKMAQEFQAAVAQVEDFQNLQNGITDILDINIGGLRKTLVSFFVNNSSLEQVTIEPITAGLETPETKVEPTNALVDIFAAIAPGEAGQSSETDSSLEEQTLEEPTREQIESVDWKAIFGDDYYHSLGHNVYNYTSAFCKAIEMVAMHGDQGFDTLLRSKSHLTDSKVDYATAIVCLDTVTVEEFREIFKNNKSNPSALKILSLVHYTKVGKFVEPEHFSSTLDRIRDFEEYYPELRLGDLLEYEHLEAIDLAHQLEPEIELDTESEPELEVGTEKGEEVAYQFIMDSLKFIDDKLKARSNSGGRKGVSWPLQGNIVTKIDGSINHTSMDKLVTTAKLIKPEVTIKKGHYLLSELDVIRLMYARRQKGNLTRETLAQTISEKLYAEAVAEYESKVN